MGMQLTFPLRFPSAHTSLYSTFSLHPLRRVIYNSNDAGERIGAGNPIYEIHEALNQASVQEDQDKSLWLHRIYERANAERKKRLDVVNVL